MTWTHVYYYVPSENCLLFDSCHIYLDSTVLTIYLMAPRFYHTNHVRKFMLKRPFHRGQKTKDNEYKVNISIVSLVVWLSYRGLVRGRLKLLNYGDSSLMSVLKHILIFPFGRDQSIGPPSQHGSIAKLMMRSCFFNPYRRSTLSASPTLPRTGSLAFCDGLKSLILTM